MNTSDQDIDRRRPFRSFRMLPIPRRKPTLGRILRQGDRRNLTGIGRGRDVRSRNMMCKELSRDPKRRTLYCTIDALSHISPHAEDEIERRCLLSRRRILDALQPLRRSDGLGLRSVGAPRSTRPLAA